MPPHAALADAQQLHHSVGAQVNVWRLLNAGTNSGLFAYAIGHDSWTAAAESAAKIQEITLGQPGPLMRLIRSGALVSSSVSALVES